jgi:hypothetical protein
MGERPEPIFEADENFRKGACHAGAWLRETARTPVDQGRTSSEVVDHLANLVRVLEDWRTRAVDLPDGNPLDWSFRDLASVRAGAEGSVSRGAILSVLRSARTSSALPT